MFLGPTDPDPSGAAAGQTSRYGIYSSVLRIRIRRIHMFLGLPDPDLSGAAAGQTSRYLLASVVDPDS
jgi:hypothetical protein